MDLEKINLLEVSKLLKQYDRDIIEGKQKLLLTASLLQKINYTIQGAEYDHVSLSGTQASQNELIQFLQQLIHQTPKLKVTQLIKRETWRIDISRFHNLRYLELINIPMHLVEGLHSVHSKLQVLVCERCTDCLEDILGTGRLWEDLQTAKLCYNDFVLLCPFTSTPWLQYLDLSYNNIKDKVSLQTLTNLRHLNLSFNFLTSVPMLSDEVFQKLRVLLINNNYIEELSAISLFINLEVLDVSNNLLAEHLAISPIIRLPNLRSVNLVSNPISFHPYHRFHTCSYLNKGVIPNEFVLDGVPLNDLEKKEIGRRGDTLRLVGVDMSRDLTCLPSGSSSQPSSIITVVKKNVRDVIIEESGSPKRKIEPEVKIEPNEDHLQTKKQIEEVRERYGGDHWLHSHAGSYVQDFMGLQKTSHLGFATSTPLIHDHPPDIDKTDRLRFDSSASDDYVTALTTKAIIEKIPHVQEPTIRDISEVKQLDLTKVTTETSISSLSEKADFNPNRSSQEICKLDFQSDSTAPLVGGDAVEESEDGQLWLVQTDRGDGVFAELFLILSEKTIQEKSTNTGCTKNKWSLESVLSCEKINYEPPTIRLTFNTIRKSSRERTYVMEYADAQELLTRVRAYLEARPLSAMHQVAYRCMKCSSMFSVEVLPSVLPPSMIDNGSSDGKSVARCPTCNTTMVVQMDEPPLPSREADLCSPMSLHQSPSNCSIGSAASLEPEPAGESTKEGTPTPRRYDSDIEIISNPSESSIEVLEVQARWQGSVTPNRKRSNEEKSSVAVPQLNTVPEVQSILTGLTESSSSGSLTDSVCTTCDTNSLLARRLGMSDVPEEPIPSPNSTITYNSLLEGYNQNVMTKSQSSVSSIDSPFSNTVQFYIKGFGQLDHRIMLYLYQQVFKDDHEELLFLLRGPTVTSVETISAYVIVSSHFLYVLSVVKETGEEVSAWFKLHSSYPVADLDHLFRLPWDVGVGVHSRNAVYMTLFYDPNNVQQFFKSFYEEGKWLCELTVVEKPKQEQRLQQLVSASVTATDSPVDSTVKYLALCAPVVTTINNEEKLRLPATSLVVTTTDLLLTAVDCSLLLPSTDSLHSLAIQKLANIVDVRLNGLQLQLHYLKEPENQEEEWSLGLSSMEVINTIVENIRGPWEQLFSVPLQLTVT